MPAPCVSFRPVFGGFATGTDVALDHAGIFYPPLGDFSALPHYHQRVLDSPATLTITRRSPKDVKQRHIFVSLDGERVAELAYGQTISREVPPGPHVLRAHNTLVWKTLHCELTPGEHARFIVVNRPGFATWAMLSLLGTGPIYLTFEREA